MIPAWRVAQASKLVGACGDRCRRTQKGAIVRRKVAMFVVSGLLLALSTAASADVVYHFQGITNNSATDTLIGETQLYMTVSDATAAMNDGKPYVDFLFENLGPAACSITQIYWDDGSNLLLKSIQQLFQSGGSGSRLQA
jgi:hypothetical protein